MESGSIPGVLIGPQSTAEREQLKHELDYLEQQIQIVSHDELVAQELQTLEMNLPRVEADGRVRPVIDIDLFHIRRLLYFISGFFKLHCISLPLSRFCYVFLVMGVSRPLWA